MNAWLRRMDEAGWRGAEKVFGWSFYSQGTDRLSSSDEFVDAALRWFGDREPTAGSPWDKGERLAALVREHRAILVLDGVEPLQWGPGVETGKLKDPALQALVKELGAQNKGLCVLTSRITLSDLEALAGDKVQEHALDHLSDEAGAELLKARGAKGLDEELQAAAREYEGHSFALTLLGSYVREAYKGDIRRRERIPAFAGEPARRMMATYEKWFARKPEIAVLRMLGFFDRPAPADEIEVLRAKPKIPGLTTFLEGPPRPPPHAWERAVTRLRDVGLLAPASEADERDKLDAHPLVRAYFAEVMRRQQPEAFREGHRRLYVYLKDKKATQLPETIEGMAPLYAAVVHGCLAGKSAEALAYVWSPRIRRGNEQFNIKKLGAFGSEVALLSVLFDPPWDQMLPGLSGADEAHVLNQVGFTLRGLGRLAEAAELLRRALAKGVAQKNWKGAATRAANLSDVLLVRGELHPAIEEGRKSVEFADRSGDDFSRMVYRAALAASLHALGIQEKARALFQEAESMQREMEHDEPLLYSRQGFLYCDLLLDLGRDADVRERGTYALKLAEYNHWLLATALDHLSLGRAHLLGVQCSTGGDLAEATSHLRAALDGFRRSGDQTYVPLGLLARAALHIHTRAFDLARKDLTEALTIATRCGFRLHACDAHLGLARLAFAKEKPDEARPHVDRARDLITATGYHRRDGELEELTRKLAGAPQA